MPESVKDWVAEARTKLLESLADFDDTLAAATRKGFAVLDRPLIGGRTDRSALLSRRA